MSTIFRIYHDTTLTEQNMGEQTAFAMGSGKKDDIFYRMPNQQTPINLYPGRAEVELEIH